MELKSIRTGSLKEVFDAIEEALTQTGVDYYLVGAQARDHWFAKGGKRARLTHDVDFAVLVGSKEDYQFIRKYLEDHKQFRQTKQNAFVMLSPDGKEIDILPFGEIEIDNEVSIEGVGLTNIKVNGFWEVYQKGTEKADLETGHQFKVATLPAIVLLKLIAFDDRPDQRGKDAGDISNIIEHYFDLQSDIIYENHSDLFVDDLDEKNGLKEVAASVIGRQIKSIIEQNLQLMDRVRLILENHINKKEQSAFVRGMILSEEDTIEQKIKLLQSIHSSLIQ